MVFLDDVLIYSHFLEEHAEHIELVLNTLREHQLYLKQTKCSFAQHKWSIWDILSLLMGLPLTHRKPLQ